MKTIASFVFLLSVMQGCAQAGSAELKQLEQLLAAKETTVNQVLADEKWMKLHSQTAFRELIKKYAPQGNVVLITSAEPGKKIRVKCTVTDEAGKPLAGALVYAYQTSSRGWYADTAAHIQLREGDMRHARLFGYVYTDDKGMFELSTIQPSGYPGSDLPAHIHLAMWYNGAPLRGVPGELLFDDDERLTPSRRQRALSEGFIIATDSGRSGEHEYRYQFSVKQ